MLQNNKLEKFIKNFRIHVPTIFAVVISKYKLLTTVNYYYLFNKAYSKTRRSINDTIYDVCIIPFMSEFPTSPLH